MENLRDKKVLMYCTGNSHTMTSCCHLPVLLPTATQKRLINVKASRMCYLTSATLYCKLHSDFPYLPANPINVAIFVFSCLFGRSSHLRHGLGRACAGGVRCERASAYMRSKGIKDVYQLAGGIHCYQERFPDGGFFQGKNFVYDPRIALPYPGSGPAREQVVGRCRVCSSPFDDYAAQVRCRLCRMLQLVCDDCRAHDEDFKANGVVCKCCPAAATAAKPGKPRRANAVNTSGPTTDSISPAADKSDKELRSAQSSSPSVWRSIENTAAPSETGGAQAGSIHGSSEINHDTHDTVAPTICNSINCSGDDGVDVSRGGV